MNTRFKIQLAAVAAITSGLASLAYPPEAEAASCFRNICLTSPTCPSQTTLNAMCQASIPAPCTTLSSAICLPPPYQGCVDPLQRLISCQYT